MINAINETIVTQWNWYSTGNTYLNYEMYSWLRNLFVNIVTVFHEEIEALKKENEILKDDIKILTNSK